MIPYEKISAPRLPARGQAIEQSVQWERMIRLMTRKERLRRQRRKENLKKLAAAAAGGTAALGALVAARAALSAAPRRPAYEPPRLTGRSALYAWRLGEMIRQETVSSPGQRDFSAFRQYHAKLEELFPHLFAACEKRTFDGTLLLRWPGEDEALRPMMLMAHCDVVAASEEGWQHPPFAGESDGGFVWGRGAIDTKDTMCAFMSAADELIEEGFTPRRSVYFLCGHNEECSGDGVPQAVHYLQEQGVRLESVLDEGGHVTQGPLPGLKGWYALCSVAEKGYAEVRFTARSAGGHASTPGRGTPIARLADFIHEVESSRLFPVRLDAVTRRYLAAAGANYPFCRRLWYENLWLFGPLAARRLSAKGPGLHALVSTTCAFTLQQGGVAANVIPPEASVTANLRFSTHESMRHALAVMEKLARRHRLEMTLVTGRDATPAADVSSQGYRRLKKAIRQVFPSAGILPDLELGGTDSRHLTAICGSVVRFSPIEATPEQLGAMHGINEHVSIAALTRAVEFYRAYLTGFDEKS